MKYPAHLYAEALAEVVVETKKGSEEKVVKNFLALVRKNGDEAHLRKLVEEAARLVRRKSGMRKVTVETARKMNNAQNKVLYGFIQKNDVLEERIDPTLIAGVRIILNEDMQFDGSLKGKLDKMFAAQERL